MEKFQFHSLDENSFSISKESSLNYSSCEYRIPYLCTFPTNLAMIVYGKSFNTK